MSDKVEFRYSVNYGHLWLDVRDQDYRDGRRSFFMTPQPKVPRLLDVAADAALRLLGLFLIVVGLAIRLAVIGGIGGLVLWLSPEAFIVAAQPMAIGGGLYLGIWLASRFA